MAREIVARRNFMNTREPGENGSLVETETLDVVRLMHEKILASGARIFGDYCGKYLFPVSQQMCETALGRYELPDGAVDLEAMTYQDSPGWSSAVNILIRGSESLVRGTGLGHVLKCVLRDREYSIESDRIVDGVNDTWIEGRPQGTG